ncbi:adenylate/guanylate cyclase domain-containing protein [Litoreibacter roseus]|nr:adenylate/guanylate cyclase domain-containing protein [Litoreibacter roseus]
MLCSDLREQRFWDSTCGRFQLSTPERKSVILAADVVGYSQMMDENHQTALEALRDARDSVIEPCISSGGGEIVKRLGDGWLAAFDAGEEACASALEIQKQLTFDGAPALRIGIHEGTVSFVDEDVFGSGVNIASRLEALAKPGGIAISDVVFANLPKDLQVSFENAGARLLKNIAEPVKVWAFGGIPPTGGSSEPISVLLENFVERSSSSKMAPDILDAVAIELEKYRWLKVQRTDDDAAASKYYLRGTLRRSGERVRVTVDLSARHDGRRLWSERFDRVVIDEFELVDELGMMLARRISAEIDTYEKMRAEMRPPEQLNAAELSARANDLMSSGLPDAFDEADAMLTRAVALEPRNTSAYIQKSFVGYRKAMSGAWPVHPTLAAALQPAMEVVRIDPKMPGGYVMLASVYGMMGKTEAAFESAAQVERLNPNAWGAPHGKSIACTFASPDWAQTHDPDGLQLLSTAERTLELAESSKFRSGHLFFLGIGQLLHNAENLQPAVSTLERSAGAAGATWWPSLFLALVELRRGKRPLAQQHIAAAHTLFPAFSMSVIADIFERSRIWPLWRLELAQLSNLDLST